MLDLCLSCDEGAKIPFEKRIIETIAGRILQADVGRFVVLSFVVVRSLTAKLSAVGYGKDCLDEKLPLSRYCVPTFEKTTVKVKKITFFIFSFVCLSVNAQQWQWAKNIGGWSLVSTPTIKTNSVGEVFSAVTNGYNPAYSSVTKRTSSGAVVWSQPIGGWNTAFHDLSLDNSNSSYVLGHFAHNLVFPDTTIWNNGDWEFFIASFDQYGNRKFIKRLLLPSSGFSIINDNNGDLIFANSSDFLNLWTILKISPNGNVTSQKNYSTTATIKKIRCDSQNNIYLGGYVNAGQLDIDSISYYNNNSYVSNSFLAKLDSAAEIKSIEIIPGAYISDFGLDSQDNIYLNGFYEKKMKVRQYNLVTDSCYSPYFCPEYFLCKLNTEGSCSWIRESKKIDFGNALAVAPNGDCYSTGLFDDSLNIDSISMLDTVRTGIFVLKFDSNGTVQWAQKDAGSYSSGSCSYDIEYSVSHSIYISGSYSTFSNSQAWFGNDTLPHVGQANFYIAKMVDGQINSIESEIEYINSILIFPNPSSGIFTIDMRDHQDAKICVYDILGNCLLNKVYDNEVSPKINLSNQPRGIYFVELLSDGERTVKKIILQ